MTDNILPKIELTEEAKVSWDAFLAHINQKLRENGHNPRDVLGKERAYVEGAWVVMYIDLPDGSRARLEIPPDQWKWRT